MEHSDIPETHSDETKDNTSDNETVVSVSEVGIRKSTRLNKGVPPLRFGDAMEPKNRLTKSAPEVASSIKSTQSEIRRRKLKSDLEAERRIAELEAQQEAQLLAEKQLMREKQLAREKKLIEMQRELEHAEIDEEAENSEEEREVPFDHKLDDLRDWVKNLPAENSAPSVKSNNSSTSANTSPDPVVSLAQTMAQAMTDAFKNISLSSTTSEKVCNNASLMRKTMIKDLPEFHGRPEEWPVFICTYKRSTEVCQFSEEENMARLQKCLKGEALKAVQILLISPNNATKIVSTLEKLFGQPRQIVRHLITKAKTTPPVKDDKSLIEYSQAISNLVQTIKMLEYDQHLSNPQLYEEMLLKLPTHYRHEWAASLESGKEECLEEFARWVETVQNRVLRVYIPRSESIENPTKPLKPKKTVLLTTESSSEPQKKTCTYCEKNGHQIWNCRNFKALSVVDRGQFVREKRTCFRCLEMGHISSKCSSNRECGVENCKGKHHRLLHGMPYEKSNRQAQPKEEDATGSTEQILCLNNQINYAVLPIILKGPKGETSTHAMIDTGSAFTLIDESLAKTIGLAGKDAKLSFRTLSPENQSVNSQVVSLSAINPKSKACYKLENVHTYPNLSLRSGTLNKSHIKKWKHLRDLDLPTYVNANPKILIGLPHADLITTTKCPRNAPIAIETKLGWVIMGDMKVPIEAERPDQILHVMNKSVSLHESVKSFFSCEDFGVKLSKHPRYSKDEQRAIDMAKSTAKKLHDRFEIGLLWAKDDVTLPESRTTALKRLKSLERKLDQDASYAEKYCKNMQHYIDSNYITKLSKEDLSQNCNKIWYLPNFGVERDNKPGKLRLVFDAASKSNGMSLNDVLLKGPDILKPLPSVLCKFRQGKIALTGDIKEMFHQVHMKSTDQNAQRLLWRGMNRKEPPSEYKMQVMTFGASCSPYSAQFIKNLNAEVNSQKFPRAAEAIINRHYVDDMLDSCDSVQEANQLFKDVFYVQKQGGFHVCNWASNSKEVMKSVPEELRSESQKILCKSEDATESEKVLGLIWQPSDDTFTFSLNFSKVRKEVVNGCDVPTKREALSLIMSIFDPLGFVANLTVKAKILLQKTWRSNIDWDDPLPESIYKIWKNWTKELQLLPSFRVPRCYSPNLTSAKNIQLHVFCDASELAYAAVAYFRVEHMGRVEVSFVAAKTRVTPLKPITVPRCELQAALMGARLAKSICEWHSVTPTEKFFWTDSRTVACWLRMMDGTMPPNSWLKGIVTIIPTTKDGQTRWAFVKRDLQTSNSQAVYPRCQRKIKLRSSALIFSLDGIAKRGGVYSPNIT